MSVSIVREDYAPIPRSPAYLNGCPVSISVCTSAQESDVRGFMDDLAHELGEKITGVRYQQLTCDDVDLFSFEDNNIDVMILCHSIHDRGFAITDVTDAIYNQFLTKATVELGKENVGVIVHDFDMEKITNDDQYNDFVMEFRHQQPTTFESASLIQLSGQLGVSPVEFGQRNWSEIRDFVSNSKASFVTVESPPPAKVPCCTRRRRRIICIALACPTIVILVLIFFLIYFLLSEH